MTMRRLLVRHPDAVGLVMPVKLMPYLEIGLHALSKLKAIRTPPPVAYLLQEETNLTLHWLDTMMDNRGLSLSAVARLAGVGYDAILSRIRRGGGHVQREGRMLVLPPETAVRLAWPRLLLSTEEPPKDGNYCLSPMTRTVLQALALEWHSLLFPPDVRELAQALVGATGREVRGDQVARLLGKETLKRRRRSWQREPVAVRVISPARTLAATTFAAEDIVRLWWNRCTVIGDKFHQLPFLE